MTTAEKVATICKHCRQPIRKTTAAENVDAGWVSQDQWIHVTGLYGCNWSEALAEPSDIAKDNLIAVAPELLEQS